MSSTKRELTRNDGDHINSWGILILLFMFAKVFPQIFPCWSLPHLCGNVKRSYYQYFHSTHAEPDSQKLKKLHSVGKGKERIGERETQREREILKFHVPFSHLIFFLLRVHRQGPKILDQVKFSYFPCLHRHFPVMKPSPSVNVFVVSFPLVCSSFIVVMII